MRMDLRRIGEMSERVAVQAIRPALEHHELRLVLAQMRDDTRPGFEELAVACAGRERDVELGALGSALAGLAGITGPGVQIASVLVDIGEDQVGVVLVRVKDAVAVVHIDVDVGDAADAVLAAQGFDHHPQVVEHAEPGRAVAARVMQSADGLEGTATVAAHDLRQAVQRGARHSRAGVVYTWKYRSVAIVEEFQPVALRVDHGLDVLAGMEALDLLA